MAEQDILLAPRAHTASEVAVGESLRITVVDGQQVPDIVLWARDDAQDRLSPSASQLLNESFLMVPGCVLHSQRTTALAAIDACTAGAGVIVGGSCSAPLNYARFGIPDTPNCRTNLLAAGAPYGAEEADVQHIYCPFMTIRRDADGSYVIDLPEAESGDYVELRALTDLVVLTSNCPQERTPTNAFNPSRLHVWVGPSEADRPTVGSILEEAARA
ncbi:urea carboxylase-associated family protein [Conexibacter sp. JD483]|uniref:urea carboxylase-associated family protein n=1 Tax=unclassified Conexibacter TaxID=2627773 RepID=UPI00271732BE|nr:MULTISPECIES: urea carboxylase-associated family protein [unclassified Conexibacter]MDO8187663.1 urea carboxylase-associated family protein [Conexibacter sp. CPCC 205706]MDO8199848.1 urea carboxylase-associated family protein [Conexibacter sp. CPCC 205762]MDR9370225.1 urea carboxylase-associated family protein [Conexibacter sp. JD483]